jgi:excisionase family DNA binding protein
MPSVNPSDLISISSAAEKKSCSRTTLYRAINDGRITAVEAAGRKMIVHDADFEGFEPRWRGQRVRRHRDDDSDSS